MINKRIISNHKIIKEIKHAQRGVGGSKNLHTRPVNSLDTSYELNIFSFTLMTLQFPIDGIKTTYEHTWSYVGNFLFL